MSPYQIIRPRLLAALLACSALASPAVPAEAAPANELTLSQAIEQALGNNLELRVQRLAPSIAAERIVEQQAAFDPVLSASAQLSQQEETIGADTTSSDARSYLARITQRIATGAELRASANLRRNSGTRFDAELNQFVGGASSQRASVTLSLSQPLLRDFGSKVNKAAIRRANSQLRESRYRLQNDTLDLLQATELAYWRLADSYERRALRDSNLQLAQKQLEESRERRRLGAATELEVLQAEANLARRQQEIIRSEQAITDAADELHALLGQLNEELPIDAQPSVQELPLPTDRQPDFAPVLQAALSQNFNTAIQGEILHQLEQDLILARNRHRPELDLSLSSSLLGQSDTQARDAFENALDRDGDEWGVGLNFSLPWGKRASKAGLRRSEYAIDQAELQLSHLKQDLIKTTRSAWRAHQTALQQLQASELVVKLQEATYSQEESKYKEGLSTLRDVLEIQRDLDNAVLSYLDAQLNAIETEVRLERVQGSLLQRHALAWDNVSIPIN